MNPGGRKRVLFVAEAVSLAHVARPYELARSLAEESEFEIHFATARRYPIAFHQTSVRERAINSIKPEEFRLALAQGRPIYDERTLSAYVDQEFELLDDIRPDVVVGDFRLSLAVSAPARRVHYMTISNAHWSSYSTVHRLPLPEHRLGTLVGPRIGKILFNLVNGVVFAHHAAALNKVRRRHGLPSLGSLRDAYTWADTTLYADVPELVPTLPTLPPNHRYIGPVLWSPDVPRPDWWSDVANGTTCIYVTLGSTGRLAALPHVLDALAGLQVTVLLATAGRPMPALPSNVKSADFLPGDDAVRRSALVVCNGGSATVYQALAQGKPVLGIPSNLDQHLTMDAVVRAGAGLALRAEKARSADVSGAVLRMIRDPAFAANARKVEHWFAAYDAQRIFRETLDQVGRSDRAPGAVLA